MKTRKPSSLVAASLAAGLSVLVATACASAEEKPEPGRAEIWEATCTRCHLLRSPTEFSDREWEVIVHHMRVRGNLTAEEHEAIVEFLKSAN